MHGQALLSVYVNGPNACEIAFSMITSWHWDCYTVYHVHCYVNVLKGNMLANNNKLQYFWYSWLSILMAHDVRLKQGSETYGSRARCGSFDEASGSLDIFLTRLSHMKLLL